MSTPRIGDVFTLDGVRYEVTKVPSFSTVVGMNMNPVSGKPSSVKILIREGEWE